MSSKVPDPRQENFSDVSNGQENFGGSRFVASSSTGREA